MKVLMFGWEFPPHISGGLGTACLGLTRQMAKQNAEITFVVPKIKGEMPHNFLQFRDASVLEGVSYEELVETHGHSFSHVKKYFSVDSILSPYLNEETYRENLSEYSDYDRWQTRKLMENRNSKLFFSGDYGQNLVSEVERFSMIGSILGKNEDVDIIHAHDWLTYMAGIEAKKASGKPLVAHIHATEFDRSGENVNQKIYDIERMGFENADQVIAVSERTRQTVIDRYGISPEKVDVVYNGVDDNSVKEFREIHRGLAGKKIVTFLGRITMQKGPEYFVEAAERVLKKVDDVHFVMAGSGDMFQGIIQEVASKRIADRFHFTGFLREAEREKLFAMSDLYVMPSVSEPFGITPLEAMRYKVPIIISKQSGVAEVLRSAIKVDFWDVDRLASSIINVLKSSELKNELTNVYPQELQRLNWADAAHRVLQIYKRVLKPAEQE